MKIPMYLAMTAEEIANCPVLPPNVAWMSCLFSPYGTGLVGLPETLPERSILILSDRIPIHGHDPVQIRAQLLQAVRDLKCEGILLDLQYPGICETQKLVDTLLELPIPVCVSENYAQDRQCPVFLPPVPLQLTPEEYLAPWQGREIWLDTDRAGLAIIVSEAGSRYLPLSRERSEEGIFPDEALICHYRLKLDGKACFFLSRTAQDTELLLQKASGFGVTKAVQLFQEHF